MIFYAKRIVKKYSIFFTCQSVNLNNLSCILIAYYLFICFNNTFAYIHQELKINIVMYIDL